MGSRNKTALVFADTDNGGIIHVANIKGGVGKSTVATNLAASLSEKGPTLLIDLDVQGSASVALGKDPADCARSSWELFSRRFGVQPPPSIPSNGIEKISQILRSVETRLFGWVIGSGEITSLALKVKPSLDLIPANSDLFKNVTFFHIQNLLYNLQLCRSYYKYIVIDTPSIWSRLTFSLYLRSSINLIPVTLNALSTKSLKDYLLNVKRLTEQHPGVRIRVVKNEVFGKENSKIKGKTRTMVENRRFLDQLCEQVLIQTGTGVSMVPQSIILDLEIPESAVVRDAQDEGKTVQEYHQYAHVTKAFNELAKRMQYILNSRYEDRLLPFWEAHPDLVSYGARGLAAAAFLVALCVNKPAVHPQIPRPLAPQQLIESPDSTLMHTVSGTESIYKLAKHAISRFRAVVPSMRQVQSYVTETIDIYNNTRLADEPRIERADLLPSGITVGFYPPQQILNPNESQLVPVYNYFLSMVKDPYTYITGDWCERGTGGGKPHYGIDVAGAFGSTIVAPVEGIAYIRHSPSAGRTVGIVREGSVIFFCHLDKLLVSTGFKVAKGQAIGTIGMSGVTSGPHVHVGYGIKTLSAHGLRFGSTRYEVTDPKLFFYREAFVERLKSGNK
jgi:cellulose biosynthesis protein BcsQ